MGLLACLSHARIKIALNSAAAGIEPAISNHKSKRPNRYKNNNTQDDIYVAIMYGMKPFARVHFGSSEQKSVNARWPPTRRSGCKLDL